MSTVSMSTYLSVIIFEWEVCFPSWQLQKGEFRQKRLKFNNLFIYSLFESLTFTHEQKQRFCASWCLVKPFVRHHVIQTSDMR